MSERFAGRTNEWWFKLFMACDNDILNALEFLDHRDLSHEGYTISLAYTKMNDFRWFLYSNNAVEDESLPPPPNNWITNTAYSTSTLRSNDLEKGWEKPPEHPFSGRLWLGV